jgi:hypothetical protein
MNEHRSMRLRFHGRAQAQEVMAAMVEGRWTTKEALEAFETVYERRDARCGGQGDKSSTSRYASRAGYYPPGLRIRP